ncbi:hypothetical protein [Streptomyces sp. NPDC001536]|uniref:hypothetical protein n=1 Tax=Streptomyces sp. NPDC001536 TaxID=3364583 RepID=UPI0036851D55
MPDRVMLAAQRAALVESERTRRVALTACKGWLACIALFLLSVAAGILWVAWPEDTSQTITRSGFDIRFIPDTDTEIAPAALGAAAGVVLAALVMAWRDRIRIEGPLLALRRALVTYAQHGHATHREREGELVAHAQSAGSSTTREAPSGGSRPLACLSWSGFWEPSRTGHTSETGCHCSTTPISPRSPPTRHPARPTLQQVCLLLRFSVRGDVMAAS